MTLDPYHPPTDVAVYSAQDVAVQRLAEWAQSAQAASVIAAELVRTSFVPNAFKGKPGEATAAILAGLECGLQPMAALRSFDIISGQAAPRAITLRAIAQSYGHEMVLEESTATRCKMRGRRSGASEWQTVTWTIDRAKSLNLLGKQNWRTQPQAMLIARATSELARLIAADAILGLGGYSVEEIYDGAGAGIEPAVTTTELTATPETTSAGTRNLSRNRATLKPVADPPPTEPEQPTLDTETPDAEAPDVLSDSQMKKLRALYNNVGVNGADRQKAVTATLLDVDRIDTHSTLTTDQASTIIDQLTKVETGEATFTIDDNGDITGINIDDPDAA